jgi:uncharacterized protein (TIGR04562 family)
MPGKFLFLEPVLQSVVGGKSVLDQSKLQIANLQEAEAFMAAYGFDYQDPDQQERLWYFHRRALVFMEEKLKVPVGQIPPEIADRKTLVDLRYLLIWASLSEASRAELQKWSCAVLRVMHVFVHTENDLFSSFSEDIQKQVLTPLQNCVFHDGNLHKTFLRSPHQDALLSNIEIANKGSLNREAADLIELAGFEVKPFKTSTSSVIKLLAKPDALAMSIFDRLGIRFITRNIFDAFRVVRFLVQENLISYPHIMPDQSSNNLYPVELFLQVCRDLEEAGSTPKESELEQILRDKLNSRVQQAEMLRKENIYSGADYQFIKFICRRLVRIEVAQKQSFSFFFPFEIQILDKASHAKGSSGPSEHQAYKERQRVAAYKRVFRGWEE